ncbi:MAG: ArsR family transcriptional regulator [Deltaproteobacteria bacterium]|nr:ArsR family transcriptional regulator [Deltaproteobacteria bacterium]MBW2053119.1 ArsR family transcriptional regulator [Deltaproteobacteria bacterium]MBW2141452.1 ArsR family transcriptional regulator [Deltaproteobacteria bacterium]MBW2322577.1 ArsR family transcriptional regulator [Deltaproteobacteria bacterium]
MELPIRQQIVNLLSQKEMSVRDISQSLGIKEKDVYEHLSHIARSVSTRQKKLIVRPAECLLCGYVFKNRKRFTPPGRCPRCKKTHLSRPIYRVKKKCY